MVVVSREKGRKAVRYVLMVRKEKEAAAAAKYMWGEKRTLVSFIINELALRKKKKKRGKERCMFMGRKNHNNVHRN